MKYFLLILSLFLCLSTSLFAQDTQTTNCLNIVGTWKYNADSGKGEIEFLPDSSFNINARISRSFEEFGNHIDAAVNVKGKGMWSVEGDSVLSRAIDVESIKLEIINVNIPGVDPELISRGIRMVKENAMEPIKRWLHNHPDILTSRETVTSISPNKITTEEIREGFLEQTIYKKR